MKLAIKICCVVKSNVNRMRISLKSEKIVVCKYVLSTPYVSIGSFPRTTVVRRGFLRRDVALASQNGDGG